MSVSKGYDTRNVSLWCHHQIAKKYILSEQLFELYKLKPPLATMELDHAMFEKVLSENYPYD